MAIWYEQYQSIDGNWYDNRPFYDLQEAVDQFEMQKRSRGHGWALKHRIVERIDRTVWPIVDDPAQIGGA